MVQVDDNPDFYYDEEEKYFNNQGIFEITIQYQGRNYHKDGYYDRAGNHDQGKWQNKDNLKK